MFGVIDIGSNTIRLSCYKTEKNGAPDGRPLHYVIHKKSIAGLASYIKEDGALSEKGIKKLLEVLTEMRELTKSLGLQDIFVFATASLRNIINTDAVLLRAKEATGYEIQVITGEEEARLDFLGAMAQADGQREAGEGHTSGMLVDIGGGSTELVEYEDRKIRKAVSVPVGSLNLRERFVEDILPEPEEIRQMKKAVKKELSQLGEWENETARMIGVGGTCRAVCKLYNEKYGKNVENQRMETGKIQEMLQEFREDPKKEMRTILRVVPDRIHTIIPGMTVLTTILKWYDIKEVQVSEWGVREGYLLDKLKC